MTKAECDTLMLYHGWARSGTRLAVSENGLYVIYAHDPKILTLSADPEDLKAWGIGGAVGRPLDQNRWAEDRLYARDDAGHALAGFRRHRQETLALLNTLSDAQWLRGGIHGQRGRLALGDWVASLASHDDNHVDQLKRALDGRA